MREFRRIDSMMKLLNFMRFKLISEAIRGER